MRTQNDDQYKTVAILGSFGKHYNSILDAANIFKSNGINVLVPKLDGLQESNETFILLVGDNTNNPKELESEYIKKCLEADFVYVCNKDGYIGATVAFELGILSSYRQEIYFMEKPSDDLFYKLIKCPNGNIGNPEMIARKLKDEVELCWAREFFDNEHEPQGNDFQLFNHPIIDFKKSSVNSRIRSEK